MKPIIFILLTLCFPLYGVAQNWSAEQLAAANTAKNERGIAEVEREIILYLNLARLYPKQFAQKEVANYTATEHYGDQLIKSSYRKSLMAELNAMKPVPALAYSKEMYFMAMCFARESGEHNLVGHERIKCDDGYLAECCSYGMMDAKGVVMQWLIDEGIKSLGHRKICLSNSFKGVGASMQMHLQYKFCVVADFN